LIDLLIDDTAKPLTHKLFSSATVHVWRTLLTSFKVQRTPPVIPVKRKKNTRHTNGKNHKKNKSCIKAQIFNIN